MVLKFHSKCHNTFQCQNNLPTDFQTKPRFLKEKTDINPLKFTSSSVHNVEAHLKRKAEHNIVIAIIELFLQTRVNFIIHH